MRIQIDPAEISERREENVGRQPSEDQVSEQSKVKCHLSLSESNSIELTKSIECAKDYFLVIFIFKINKNSTLQTF